MLLAQLRREHVAPVVAPLGECDAREPPAHDPAALAARRRVAAALLGLHDASFCHPTRLRCSSCLPPPSSSASTSRSATSSPPTTSTSPSPCTTTARRSPSSPASSTGRRS